MSPILSRQALRQTPEFGKSRAATSPDSLRSALDAYTLVPVPIPEIPTPPLPNLEDILYFHLSLATGTLLTIG